MPQYNNHELSSFINGNLAGAEYVLAGSLGPGLTLNDLIKLSADPQATAEALNIHDINLAGATGKTGSLQLREQIARLYDQSKVKITADDVIVANATTGANLLVLQSLISPGDHVVTMYPSYAQLAEVPRYLGASISHWHLDPTNDWQTSLDQLNALLTRKTKLLVLNSPHNPTGSTLSTEKQQSILRLAAEHNIIVHCDEIFRPLWHAATPQPSSIVEHATYDRTIVTGSMSKAWCFSGLRVGWCVTRNAELKASILGLRQWVLEGTSMVDERIAAEVLSERCRDKVHSRISGFARENLALLSQFLSEHEDAVKCSLPPGGATAFVQFLDPKTGRTVDDVLFSQTLKGETKVLVPPGSLCFGGLREGDFQGYVRVHLTCLPDVFKAGLEKIGGFIGSKRYGELTAAGHGRTNGINGNGKTA